MGKKKINFTLAIWEKIDDLFEAGCSLNEVAASLGVSHDTVSRRIQEKYEMTAEDYKYMKAASGDSILRKVQFDLAVEGDRSMLIWLGKQRLGQSEKQDQNINHSGNVSISPIEWINDSNKDK